MAGRWQSAWKVAVKGNANDNATLQRFASDVHAIAPNATGRQFPPTDQAHGCGRVAQAGVLSLLAIDSLLFLALRNTRDVILTLGPLLAASVMTFATCVALGVKLNLPTSSCCRFCSGLASLFIFISSSPGARAAQFPAIEPESRRAVQRAHHGDGIWNAMAVEPPGTASMGELLMISLAWTLITLFFLPALLETAKAR